MRKPSNTSGWVYPPGKPKPPYDDQLKTSKLFVSVGIMVAVAVAIIGWWLKP